MSEKRIYRLILFDVYTGMNIRRDFLNIRSSTRTKHTRSDTLYKCIVKSVYIYTYAYKPDLTSNIYARVDLDERRFSIIHIR